MKRALAPRLRPREVEKSVAMNGEMARALNLPNITLALCQAMSSARWQEALYAQRPACQTQEWAWRATLQRLQHARVVS